MSNNRKIRRSPPWTKIERNDTICRSWEDGQSQVAIAREQGISPSAVRDILLRFFLLEPKGVEWICVNSDGDGHWQYKTALTRIRLEAGKSQLGPVALKDVPKGRQAEGLKKEAYCRFGIER